MKRIAIVQSNYIPWKGYFDLINSVDEFVLYDDAQYTRRDWRNRNKIKTPSGASWITIPVNVKGKYFQKIRETEISDAGWAERHWESIRHVYARAAHFADHRRTFEELYCGCAETTLSGVNYRFLTRICEILGIRTRLSWSMDYDLSSQDKTQRLLDICLQASAAVYVSGPAAQAYIDRELFERAGVELRFFDYSGYPEYRQLFPPFAHDVSVIDLLFNEGPDARKYMKSF